MSKFYEKLKKIFSFECKCNNKKIDNVIDFKENLIICYLRRSFIIFLISLLLIWNQIVCWKCWPVSDDSLIKIINESLFFVFINSLIILIITSIIHLLSKPVIFRLWTEVFFEYGNEDDEEKNKIHTIFWALYLPAIFYFVIRIIGHYIHFKTISIFTFFALWVTFLSFIVAVKVYFEVKRSKTKTLKEYLEIAIKAIDRMKNHETLVFIAPTLFVGALEPETRGLSKIFRDKLISKINELKNNTNSTGKIKIAILEFDNIYSAYLKYKRKIENKKIYINNEDENKVEELIEELIEVFKEIKKPYFKYHAHFLKKSLDDIKITNDATIDWFEVHFKFLCDLSELNKEIDNKRNLELIQLNANSGSIYNIEDAKKTGFFSIANYNSGFLYLGAYKVLELGYVLFQGSWLKDTNVMTYQHRFLEDLINKNSV